MAKGKYREWLQGDNLILLQGWARDGLSDEQIAHNMGINVATLYRWKNDHSEICEALKKSKEVVDKEVENALYKSALGYDYEEITEERRFIKEKNDYELVVTKKIKRHQPPNTAAIIFWLKNRKRDVWKDKPLDDGNEEAINLMYAQLDEMRKRAEEENDNTLSDAE